MPWTGHTIFLSNPSANSHQIWDFWATACRIAKRVLMRSSWTPHGGCQRGGSCLAGLGTLKVNGESMARYGFSPPTRVFEAVGAGAYLITDEWKGIDLFLERDREVLVAADGDEVAGHLEGLTPVRAREIAKRARRRILAHQ